MISARSLALQGFLLTPIAMVVQGLLNGEFGEIEKPKQIESSGGADLEDEVDEYREEVEKIIKNAKRRQIEEEEILSAIINFVLEQA